MFGLSDTPILRELIPKKTVKKSAEPFLNYFFSTADRPVDQVFRHAFGDYRCSLFNVTAIENLQLFM